MSLIFLQIVIFGVVFFEMFCRLKATDEKTIWQVRWAIASVAFSSMANIFSIFVWSQFQYQLFLLFAFSVAVMQWAMSRQWKSSAPNSFNGQ